MKNILKTGLIAAVAMGLTTTAMQAGDHRHNSHNRNSDTIGKVLRFASQVSSAVQHSKYQSRGGSSCSSSRHAPRGYSNYRSSSRNYYAPRSSGITIRFGKSRSSCSSSRSSHRGHRH